MAYATSSDLARLGVGSGATAGIAAGDITAALDAASSLADSYLGAQYTLPLVSWGDDLRRAVCMIAAYDVIAGNRGFNPENGDDTNLRLRYQDALDWLKRLADGSVVPGGVVDSTADESDGGGAIVTMARRGW